MLKARQAYRAAVTGMDRKLGVLMDALNELGLTQNTAIVLHGDHGWHLGEHGEWRKFTNFELATRVPLIISAPWIQQQQPRSSDLVELVDLLPTITNLAGLPLPENETTPFDGMDMSVLLVQAAATGISSDGGFGSSGSPNLVKPFGFTAAFSQYPRRVEDPSKPWKSNSILHHPREQFTHMGYSVRTDEWRYTEWIVWNGSSLLPLWEKVVGRELYDHRNETLYPSDFDLSENTNLATDPEYASVMGNLSSMVHTMFE
jgi:iduronate 2-sulfatase